MIERESRINGTYGHASFSDDMVYRYTLMYRWSEARMVAFCGVNPSTADHERLDPTMSRICGFARAWGCGGVYMLNAFALRSTDVSMLRAVRDPIGPENDKAIIGTIIGLQVIAAWGKEGAYLDRDLAVLRLMADHGIRPECLHLTKDGHPGHPLYLAADRCPQPFHPRRRVS